MPVNVIRFNHEGTSRWGVVHAGMITPIEGRFDTTADFLKAVDIDALAALEGGQIAESSVTWLSPITRNQQFVCQGANYRQHMIESGVDPDTKSYNMIFTKATSCVCAADSPVIRPQGVKFLDYEIELGIVLRKDITTKIEVTKDTLHEYVGGIVIVNDYSARDVQIPQMQFYKGKSFRSFGPVGPYLCLLERSAMDALVALDLTLTVNGEVRQQDNTRNLVYSPAETLTELSGVQDLFVGDLLATGTPSGCALSIPSPAKQKIGALLPEKKKWDIFMKVQAKRTQYLKPGDIVESRISCEQMNIDLGTQRNQVIEAS